MQQTTTSSVRAKASSKPHQSLQKQLHTMAQPRRDGEHRHASVHASVRATVTAMAAAHKRLWYLAIELVERQNV
jgi:hypothetical protein